MWVGVWRSTIYPVGIGKVDQCMFFSSFTPLPTVTTTTPLTPEAQAPTHAHIKVVRVHSRVHKDPTELHDLDLFQRTSPLSRWSHNRAEPRCSPYLNTQKLAHVKRNAC